MGRQLKRRRQRWTPLSDVNIKHNWRKTKIKFHLIMEVDMEIDDLRSEDGDEYEEFLVYIDIDPTSIAVNQISESSLKIFGMETNKPLLQINNQFFEGKKTKQQ